MPFVSVHAAFAGGSPLRTALIGRLRRSSAASKLVLCALTPKHAGVQAGWASLQSAQPGAVPGFGLTTVVFVLGIQVLLSGLTWPGVVSSWLLGGSVFSAFGAGGFALVCVYFIAGSAVTKFKLREKQAAGIAEERSGRRGVVRTQ